MPTLIEPTVPSAHSAQRHETEPSAALIGAHSEVAASVAEFDLDDSTLWQQVDSLVAATAGAAHALTRPSRVSPPLAPRAAFRLSSVSGSWQTAQRRLLAALDRYPPPDDDVFDRATELVCVLSRDLRCAALSRTASGPEPKPRSDDWRGGRRL
jgi:hypothetical protein